MITGFISAMKEMQTEFGLSGDTDMNVIARLPNVIQPKKDELGEDFVAGIERRFTRHSKG